MFFLNGAANIIGWFFVASVWVKKIGGRVEHDADFEIAVVGEGSDGFGGRLVFRIELGGVERNNVRGVAGAVLLRGVQVLTSD